MNVKNNWHNLELEEIFAYFQSTTKGLTDDEVIQKREQFGSNALPTTKRTTVFQIFIRQFLNPLIFVLVAAAFAAIAIGESGDSLFIFIVIFFNAFIGTYQEFKAEESAFSLQQLIKINARIKRNNSLVNLPAEEIVPGDIVYLESGMKVPADMRFVEVNNLEIDESFLTGESIPSLKFVGTTKENTLVAERKNMGFAGATVLKGRGIGIVVATGTVTQVGQISKSVTESESAKPPLVQRMERFMKQITVIIAVISVILAIIMRLQGADFTAIFFFIVALAVSAIPEGLPIALTVALSIATKRMAKRNVLVRKLTSVESLGSCTLIASDKTGTLTVNEQTAKVITLPNGNQFSITGEGYNGIGTINDAANNPITFSVEHPLANLIKTALIANEATLTLDNEKWNYSGDSMDIALLGLGYKFGIQQNEILNEVTLLQTIAYESEKKFAGAITQNTEGKQLFVKGAVETILGFCNRMQIDDTTVPLDIEKITTDAEALAKKGYRVLAFAYENVSADFDENNEKEFSSLVFLGLISFIDPLRPEAIASIAECHDAGIKVIMITGDHPETALTIAKELGIANQNTKVVTGQMLTKHKENKEIWQDLILSSTVFARVSPQQKLEIVEVLIDKGEFVAVTGDGVNDAPALKKANIGVAMGSGTDVAKEVGAMIVVDNNFASIVAGIEEGRFAYDNVRKVIYLLISTGTAEIFIFLVALLLGLPLPLLAVQLLWLNLVTNGIQDVSLAFEKGEKGAMKHPPRNPKESIFDRLMIEQNMISGLTMGILAAGLWYYLLEYTTIEEASARNLVLLLMVFLQNFHVFNCRSERVSTFKVPLKNNIILVFGVLLAQGIHILSMQIPFMQQILGVEKISFDQWILVAILAIPIILVMEIYKMIKNARI
jgi:calcium-translocating P-type ATPase